MSILIGADVVPTMSNYELFETGNVKELVGNELFLVLSRAEYRIFNLEVPLTDKESPIKKCGPNLIAPYKTVNGYKALGIDLLTLANNHILDQGIQGFDSTRRALAEVGIACLGAGNTPKEAAKPYIFENAGKKIGVYACAEHEFTIVSDSMPGANPYDPFASFDHVRELKAECDFAIVLYHGGKEHYQYPSPDLQKVCRKFIEKGADLIICQHTHCIGCEEKYLGGTIVYGQGNFIFDGRDDALWKASVLIAVDDDFQISYIPIVKKGNVVRMAAEDDAKQIIQDFERRSNEIRISGFIEKKYRSFAESMLQQYLYMMAPKLLITRVLNRLFGLKFRKWYVNKCFDDGRRLAIRNFIECEAHRELLLKGLSDSMQE